MTFATWLLILFTSLENLAFPAKSSKKLNSLRWLHLRNFGRLWGHKRFRRILLLVDSHLLCTWHGYAHPVILDHTVHLHAFQLQRLFLSALVLGLALPFALGLGFLWALGIGMSTFARLCTISRLPFANLKQSSWPAALVAYCFPQCR